MHNILKKFNKLGYSIIPTPVHKLENLSKFFGANIYCKRDDMTGFAFGENSTILSLKRLNRKPILSYASGLTSLTSAESPPLLARRATLTCTSCSAGKNLLSAPETLCLIICSARK